MRMVDPYILIADDDPEDRQAFSDEFALQNPGVVTKHLESGRELLHYLEGCLPDQLPTVLLLDFQMPDLTGPQILHHLAASDRYNHLIKVMWSTSVRTKDIEECKRLGATHYIVKPGTIEELKKAVHQVTSIFETAAPPAR